MLASYVGCETILGQAHLGRQDYRITYRQHAFRQYWARHSRQVDLKAGRSGGRQAGYSSYMHARTPARFAAISCKMSDSEVAGDSSNSSVAGAAHVAAPRRQRGEKSLSGPLRLYVIVVSAVVGLWPAIRIGSEWPGLPDNIEQGLLVGFVLAEAWSIRASTNDAEHECHRAMHQHLRRLCNT